METVDPTAFDINFDPTIQRMSGWARHGNTPFDVPFVSHIKGNLYQGGCENGLILPTFIENVVSLYIWEAYEVKHDLKHFEAIKMYDDQSGVDFEHVVQIAQTVRDYCKQGPTLVHCQAGLNRSALIAGTALWLDGMDSAKIPGFLRERRSPAVLCNPTFDSFVGRLDNFKDTQPAADLRKLSPMIG